MKTVKEVESNVEKLTDENWMWFQGQNGDIVRITPENITEAAKFYKVPEPFLEMLDDALRTMANDIVAELHKDLADIWDRI